jgi:hypothetical protein
LVSGKNTVLVYDVLLRIYDMIPAVIRLRCVMIYFMHVPKTAGTSMRRLFTSTISDDAIAYIYMPPSGIELDALQKMPRPRVDALKLVFGHFPYGIDARLERTGKYLTCLRETAGRLVSNYRQHVRGGFVGDMGFLEYFESWSPRDMDNYTVRLLAGVGHDLPFGGVTEAHLSLAKKNLVEHFAAFGLYEYLHESIQNFSQILGLRPVKLGQENATPAAQSAQNIPQPEIAAVVAHNALDVQLYAFAKASFLERQAEAAAQMVAPASKFLNRLGRFG